jgi:hypothetical protein
VSTTVNFRAQELQGLDCPPVGIAEEVEQSVQQLWQVGQKI